MEFIRFFKKIAFFFLNLKNSFFSRISSGDIELITKTDLFNSMRSDQFDRLCRSAKYKKYLKHSLILKENEMGVTFYIITDGSVRVFTYNNSGEKISLARLQKGDYFGEQALIGQANKTRNASIEAITDVTVIEIHEKYFSSFLDTSPDLKRKLKKIGYNEALKILKESVSIYDHIKYIIEQIKTPTIIEYHQNKVIFSEGDPADQVYFILQGKVEIIFPDKNDKSKYLSVICHRGQIFGELGVIRNKPRAGTAIAREELRLLVISSDTIKKYLEENPSLRKIFNHLEHIYQIPARGTVEQYSGTTKVGEQLTSIFKMNDGRIITSSSFFKQDMLVMTNNNVNWDKNFTYVKGDNKIEIFVDTNNHIVSIKSWGWWDSLPQLCELLLSNTTIDPKVLQSFEETGDLVIIPESKPGITRDIICECMLVSRATLQQYIEDGIREFNALSKATGACSVCRCCKYRMLELLGENPWISATMQKIAIHNDIIRSFILEPIESRFAEHWEAGQHIIIQAKIGSQWVERTYTLSDLNKESLRITIKKETNGVFTRWLFEQAPDHFKVNVAQPQGEFILDMKTNKAALCFAGGIGITPFISYAKFLNEQKLKKRLHILYCSSKKQDFILQDEFSKIEELLPAFTITYYTTEEQGPLTPKIIHELVNQFNQPDVYICGSQAFVKHIVNSLRSINYSSKMIHHEAFLHAGGESN